MTTGAEKLWNAVHGVAPPRQTPPDHVLPQPPTLTPEAPNEIIEAIRSDIEARMESKESGKPMQKFWILIDDNGDHIIARVEGAPIPKRFSSKEEAITVGKEIAQNTTYHSMETSTYYLMEAVAVVRQVPLPKVEVVDL